LVIRRDSDTINLGQTFAHEGGHYLGLEHADEPDGCNDTDPDDSDIDDNFIFLLQGEIVKKLHCVRLTKLGDII
jgi:hypothetical protein